MHWPLTIANHASMYHPYWPHDHLTGYVRSIHFFSVEGQGQQLVLFIQSALSRVLNHAFSLWLYFIVASLVSSVSFELLPCMPADTWCLMINAQLHRAWWPNAPSGWTWKNSSRTPESAENGRAVPRSPNKLSWGWSCSPYHLPSFCFPYRDPTLADLDLNRKVSSRECIVHNLRRAGVWPIWRYLPTQTLINDQW